MKITPMGATPQAPAAPQTNSAAEARQRAISMLTGQAPQVNQNAVQAEEQQAVAAPKEQSFESAVEAAKSTGTETESQAIETTEESTVETKKTESHSSQLALLARKERALRAQAQKQEQALKAREEALAKREAELTGRPSFDSKQYVSKADLQTRALDVLLENGVDANAIYEQLTKVGNVDPRVSAEMQAMREELKAMKAEREAQKAQAEEATSAQYKAAVQQITRDVTNLVKDDPTFEMVKETGSIKDVVELIEATFKEEGYLMTIEDAAAQVEEYLIEQAEKLARTKKIQARLTPKSPEAATKVAGTEQKQSAQQPQQKTLTNSISTTTKLSARERAIAAMEGRLK